MGGSVVVYNSSVGVGVFWGGPDGWGIAGTGVKWHMAGAVQLCEERQSRQCLIVWDWRQSLLVTHAAIPNWDQAGCEMSELQDVQTPFVQSCSRPASEGGKDTVG